MHGSAMERSIFLLENKPNVRHHKKRTSEATLSCNDSSGQQKQDDSRKTEPAREGAVSTDELNAHATFNEAGERASKACGVLLFPPIRRDDSGPT